MIAKCVAVCYFTIVNKGHGMPYVLTDRKHFHAHRYGKLSPIRNFSLSNVIELYVRSIMGQKKKNNRTEFTIRNRKIAMHDLRLDMWFVARDILMDGTEKALLSNINLITF